MPTCGPVGAEVLCPDCAIELGSAAWCDGHADAGARILAALPDLPGEWAVVTRLWWVATGEVRLERLVLPPALDLPAPVRAALDP